MVKVYTNTEEGKYVLDILSNAVCTSDMEVYKCEICEDLFGATPDDAEERPVCGICQMEIDAENYIPGEHEDYDYEEGE